MCIQSRRMLLKYNAIQFLKTCFNIQCYVFQKSEDTFEEKANLDRKIPDLQVT